MNKCITVFLKNVHLKIKSFILDFFYFFYFFSLHLQLYGLNCIRNLSIHIFYCLNVQLFFLSPLYPTPPFSLVQ